MANKNGWINVQDTLKNKIQAKWNNYRPQKIHQSWLTNSGSAYYLQKAIFDLKKVKKLKSDLVDSFFKLVNFDQSESTQLEYKFIGSQVGCTAPVLEPYIKELKDKAEEIWKKILDQAPLMSYIDTSHWESPVVLTYLQEKLNNK